MAQRIGQRVIRRAAKTKRRGKARWFRATVFTGRGLQGERRCEVLGVVIDPNNLAAALVHVTGNDLASSIKCG